MEVARRSRSPARSSISITSRDLLIEEQLPGLPPLQPKSTSRLRRTPKRRCRRYRGVQAADHAGSQARVRGARREARRGRKRRARDAALEQAAYGWDASPISTARCRRRLWAQIKNEDWSLVSDVAFMSDWPRGCGTSTSTISTSAASGAYGDRLRRAGGGRRRAREQEARPADVNIQTDGDLNYAPGVLWTAAHHQIPLLPSCTTTARTTRK